MGPNKLSTFVPAANKSEVSPESELAILVLVQDRTVWDLLLRLRSKQPTRQKFIGSFLFDKGSVS